MMVSQNRTPGSADFHALCTIFFHKAEASISLVVEGVAASMGYCCVYGVPSTAACMNASSSFTETLAPVTLPSVILASINASESGCLIDTLSINAPRRPS